MGTYFELLDVDEREVESSHCMLRRMDCSNCLDGSSIRRLASKVRRNWIDVINQAEVEVIQDMHLNTCLVFEYPIIMKRLCT